MSKRSLINLAVAGAAAAVAGCGSSSSSSSTTTPAATPPATQSSGSASSGGSSVAIAANPSGQLSFVETAASAKAGAVKITFANKAPLPHNLTLADASGKVIGSTPTFTGGSKTLSATLKAGTYTYYCTVAGHRQAGMQGTLTVK